MKNKPSYTAMTKALIAFCDTTGTTSNKRNRCNFKKVLSGTIQKMHSSTAHLRQSPTTHYQLAY